MSGPARALTIWLTGLPSAGKSTIASALAARLAAEGKPVEVLDGDAVRAVLSQDLGYSRADRERNMRRVGWVADLLSRNGVFAVCALISPYRDVRAEVRGWHGDRFLEVHIAAPKEVCEARDVKGLYARQRGGEMTGLTGVDDPYEPPLAPEVVLATHERSVEECVEAVMAAVAERLVPLGSGLGAHR
ncbi:MAG: adenylyl-sulfate kinase [Acidimicrobiia bacterium]